LSLKNHTPAFGSPSQEGIQKLQTPLAESVLKIFPLRGESCEAGRGVIRRRRISERSSHILVKGQHIRLLLNAQIKGFANSRTTHNLLTYNVFFT
jgi:hypothetical protein